MDIELKVPEGIPAERIAKDFNRLLDEARFNRTRSHGPFQTRPGDESSWQLDDTNDFWLHFQSEGTAVIRCRYPREEQTLETVAKRYRETVFQ